MVSAESGSQVLLSVLTASAAILAVFVLVGTPVEKRVVQKQTAFVISDLLQDTSVLGDAKAPLQAYIKSLSTPDMSAEDAAAAASNRSLLTKAATLIGISLATGICFVKWLSSRAGFAFGPVLRQAMVSCLLAAGTEVTFLLCVAQHFISADPQYVRLQILQALAKDSQ